MTSPKPTDPFTNPGRIGLALGSGAARGWAHVGVIRELEARGLAPSVIAGCSSGSLVGALYAVGRLDAFEEWGRQLDWRQIVGYFDVTMRGGFIKARKLLDFLTEDFKDRRVDELDLPFATVATDLASGREIWLREGPLLECLQASMALPGLVAPVLHEGRWLVDGGLVNAVPVSLCRAMGADTVIAVDLSTTLLDRRAAALSRSAGRRAAPDTPAADEEISAEVEAALEAQAMEVPEIEQSALVVPDAAETEDETKADETRPSGSVDWRGMINDSETATRVRAGFHEMLQSLRERMSNHESDHDEVVSSPPSIWEVVASSINIMQIRITRSRMAGDPPELLVKPQLEDFNLLDFDRAEAAIEEGRRAVARALAASGA